MILYVHGFRSSPQSFKARLMGDRLRAMGREAEYCCPQFPASPQQAVQLALQCIDSVAPETLTVVGSSLGGYYATWLAEHTGCRAVLLNPAIYPDRDLKNHIGVTTHFHSDELFEFKERDCAELSALSVSQITHPERYFLMATTGDEVLDWTEMVAHYPGARHHVIQGSDHGIHDFAQYVDEVLEFCGV